MINKIGIIGGGFIGGVLVQEIVRRRLAREVGLADPAPFVNPNDPPERQETTNKQSVAKGKCLDIAEGTPTIRSDVKCYGSKDYSAIEGADLPCLIAALALLLSTLPQPAAAAAFAFSLHQTVESGDHVVQVRLREVRVAPIDYHM